MPQSLSKVIVHLIFSTKLRTPCLSEELRPDLFAYMTMVVKNSGSTPIVVGGYTDHVHVLFALSKINSLSKTIETLKVSTSKWVKTKDLSLHDFAWQVGYGAFSIASRDTSAVVGYIANQVAHHEKVSFQEELRALFIEHEMDFDERYLWD